MQHYISLFKQLFIIFDQLLKTKFFEIKFDGVCIKLGIEINITKKQLTYIINCLNLKFNFLKIKA